MTFSFFHIVYISFSGALGSTLIWISVICLSIHISVYTALKKLRNPPAQNLLALTCALCPAQVMTAVGLTFNTSHRYGFNWTVLIITFFGHTHFDKEMILHYYFSVNQIFITKNMTHVLKENFLLNSSICIFFATCLHYFFLVSALWVNVLHFDLCRLCFKRSLLHKGK